MAPRQCGRDARVCKKKVTDRSGRVSRPTPTRDASATHKITGHWGEDAVGFKWTEQDSVDNRLQQMDVGQFYSATIWTPKEMTLKGIAVRIGEKSEASILFDTELLRVVCGWTGEFLEFNPARYGIISPPKVGKDIAFHSPRQPGWSREGQFADPRRSRSARCRGSGPSTAACTCTATESSLSTPSGHSKSPCWRVRGLKRSTAK